MHDGDTEGSSSSSGRGHAPYRVESHPPCFRRTFSVAVYWSAKTQGMIAIRGQDYPRFALVLSGDGVSTRSLLLKPHCVSSRSTLMGHTGHFSR